MVNSHDEMTRSTAKPGQHMPSLQRLWLFLSALCMALPAPSHAQLQQFPEISGEVAECHNCLSTTEGTVTINYTWYYNSSNAQTVGTAPTGAEVMGVYLAGAPTGKSVLFNKIALTHGSWTDNVFLSKTDGTVWFPQAQLPSTVWNGQPVTGTWLAKPTVIASDSSSELKMSLVIKWRVPPPPTVDVIFSTPYLYDAGRFWGYASGWRRSDSTTLTATVSMTEDTETSPFATVRANQKYVFNHDEFVVDVPARFKDGATHQLTSVARPDGTTASLARFHSICLTPAGIPCEGSVLNGRGSTLPLQGNWGIKGGMRIKIDDDLNYTTAVYHWLQANGASVWMEARSNVIEMFPAADSYGLVRSPGGALYLLVGRARLPVVSAEAARAAGFEPSTAPIYRDDVLSRIPSIPEDGTILRETGKPAIYVIAGGARFWVPTPASWGTYRDALGLSDASIRQVPAGSLQGISASPADGTVVRELGKPALWVYQGGGRFWVASLEAWGTYKAVTGATDAIIRNIPPGSLSWTLVDVNGQDEGRVREDLPRDGTVVRELGRTGIWVYRGGGRFWVPTPASWDSYKAATGTTDASIRNIPLGSLWSTLVDVNGQDEGRAREDLPRDGTVVRQVGSPEVFIYQGGGNFWIPSPEELAAWGDAAQRIQAIPAGSLQQTLIIVNDAETLVARDDMPRDGTLIRERTGLQVYQVQDRKKYPVSGHDPAQVKLVPDGSIGRVPNG
ncbi:hypothetical protein HPC49_14445 [Pyxidicoccus fallax]|uniref:Uncharacterized protein n=1 Tax=Pyxidicoccus fallax TaxID=394095 RepID=A0A848LI13_9BACT|nr:hypothetical protein [Pyxidicoccus fallax]NMO17018.1 hypothetical protein [Pyxidicoccus fallax]NPC79431.1 hypothetical protein [Pyxidicoccus fallax]